MPSINNPARQQAQLFSSRLGQFAAGLPRTARQPPTLRHASPLAPILDSFRLPDTAAEHARHKLKANEFMAP